MVPVKVTEGKIICCLYILRKAIREEVLLNVSFTLSMAAKIYYCVLRLNTGAPGKNKKSDFGFCPFDLCPAERNCCLNFAHIHLRSTRDTKVN